MRASIFYHAFLMRNRFENFYFSIKRFLALPAWILYRSASAKQEQLTFEDLLDLNKRYATTPKPSDKAVWAHQAKWANRALEIAQLLNLQNVFEVGCGYGQATMLLSEAGLDVTTCDIVDILSEDVRKTDLKVSLADVCNGLPYADQSFELGFSINAVEHFNNPEKAIEEMIRVTKPGGYIYLTFDPLYYSAWGLHASRRLGMPYPQILFSETTIQRFVNEKKEEILPTYSEGSDTSKIGPPLNRYTVDAYRQIFNNNGNQIQMIFYTERTDIAGVNMIRRYPNLFKGYAPSFEDLIISGIKLLARRIR